MEVTHVATTARLDKHALAARLMGEEGVRKKPYRCSQGFLTIGVGRNLDANGLRPDEIQYLLANDIDEAEQEAMRFPVYAALDSVRKGAFVELCFVLGYEGLAKFHNTLAAMAAKDWALVGRGIRTSLMARQWGNSSRDEEIAAMFETGKPA